LFFTEGGFMTDKTFNVLFLCTGNSARSILAESILRADGAGKFNAYSAGSQPKGEVNPMALEVLAGHKFPIDGLRSKSWDEFAAPDAPEFDFIFTVCDNAAGEACPVWPGKPMTAHWGIEDPAAVDGTEAQKRIAFTTALRYLKLRIDAFIALPFESLERMSLLNRLKEIGELEGSTHKRPDVA
jgi:arsenate reductase (thioredoxin)